MVGRARDRLLKTMDEAESQSAYYLYSNSRLGQVLAVVLASLVYLASDAGHGQLPTVWLALMVAIAGWRFVMSYNFV